MKFLWQAFRKKLQNLAGKPSPSEAHVVFTLRGYDPARSQRLEAELRKLRKTGHEVMVLSQRDRRGLLESLKRYQASQGNCTVVV